MMKKFIALLAFTAIFVAGCAPVANPISDMTTAEELSALDMPVVFVLGGTYCPHCVTEVPAIESVWSEYKSDAAFWLQIVDGSTGNTFDTTMPQGYNENLVFSELAQMDCAYVPSWVILDAEGAVAKTSCGNEYGAEVMVEVLDGLLETADVEEEVTEETEVEEVEGEEVEGEEAEETEEVEGEETEEATE